MNRGTEHTNPNLRWSGVNFYFFSHKVCASIAGDTGNNRSIFF